MRAHVLQVGGCQINWAAVHLAPFQGFWGLNPGYQRGQQAPLLHELSVFIFVYVCLSALMNAHHTHA